ncbi:hypothetical protein WG947_03795 [Pontibacter sp. H259]|uniref:hypothetical protein n=1 Tax=Pontibacter sp. H259 TaxID=3133421 RepID=UPI0030C07BE8
MANQQESKIEDFAFDFLKNYYTQQYTAKNILVSQDEKTKRGHATDGMLAFKRPDNEVVVATVSMQQSAALTKMLMNHKSNGFGKLRFLTPLVLAAICFLIGRSAGNVLVMLIAPVIAAPLGFILHTFLLKKYRLRQLTALVDSIKQAPANEQWIGLSISSLVFRNNMLANVLQDLCRDNGIGLITVGKRCKVVLMQRPSHKPCRRADYLTYYTSEATIRRALNEDHILRVA